MGFFSPSTASIRSGVSDSSSSLSIASSSLSKSGSKLKRTELPFVNNVSAPNSRLLFATPPAISTLPASNGKSSGGRPSSIRSNRSSKSLKGGLSNGIGNGSRASLNMMESFEDSSASESESEEESEIETPIASEPLASPTKSDTEGMRDIPSISSKSRAALLATAAMERPTKEIKRLGKPLHTLTLKDVKLTEKEMKADVQEIWTAMHLFMNSNMVEAEDICLAGADHRLYYSVGFTLITVVKSFATFEPDDLEAAIQCCKDSIVITQMLRKKDGMLGSVGRAVTGSVGTGSIADMTLVERHSELIFAECTLLKAVVGILYSGDVFSFIKEAINMRNAYSIFRSLAKFVDLADQAYTNRVKGTRYSFETSSTFVTPSSASIRTSKSNSGSRSIIPDPSIDEDFRSGTYFGNGLISMILSLLPSSLLKIMEVFGFTGDIVYGLETLMKGGGWFKGVKEPTMDPAKEGIRRQMCDLALLTYHLVIPSYLPVSFVDVPTAENILSYNLERYPNGIFWLYFQGRLNATQTLLEPASDAYHAAIQAQREYIQLQHICHWDLGLVSLAGADYRKAYECYNILHKESNWSKAIYTYAKAVILYEIGNPEEEEQSTNNFQLVPSLLQRIVGKSIPLEKFIARRAKKYLEFGHRLICPGIELGYVLNCLDMAPRFVLLETHLDQISEILIELDQDGSENSPTFWDDYCLAHLLRGIVLRFITHPSEHVVSRPEISPIPVQEADEQAFLSFANVLKNGHKIQTDHHVVLFAHYELGRLYAAREEYQKAVEQYELVLQGKCTELNPKRSKGKVSLQNMVILRSNSGLQTLKESGKINF